MLHLAASAAGTGYLASLEQRSGSGPEEGWVAAALDGALWALDASSLLSPDRFGCMTRLQLLGCAMPLQQNSLNTVLLSSTSLLLPEPCFPQETYLRVPAFHRPA